MTLLAMVAVTTLWGAAVYRSVRAIRHPASHRTALAISVGLLAAAATGHFAREELDALVGQPNLTNLGSRVALAASVAGAQLYILGTRHPQPPRGRQAVILSAAAATIVVSAVSWRLAPIHRAELPDLASAPSSPASFAYAVAIYLYTAWFLADLTHFAHLSLADVRRDDPPAAVALVLIASAGWTGMPVLAVFAIHTGIAQLTGRVDPYLDGVATLLFPLPLALLALGLLLLPLLPALEHRRAAQRLSTETRGLWELMLVQHPHVHLAQSRSPLLRRLRPRLTAQRQLIEISDALEEHLVARPSTVAGLAAALRAPSLRRGESLSAKEALLSVDPSPWPDPIVHLCAAITTPETDHRS